MKAIFGFLAFVVLVIFIVVLIARGNNSPSTEAIPQLAEAANSSAVFTFTEAGPINAEENHFRIDIAISRNARNITVYRGYNNVQVASQSFTNTEAAFGEFLSAIDRANYTSERRTKYETEAGLCPSRSRYVFVSDQFDEDFRRWTTDCVEKGNFGGDFGTTSLMFRNQIPDLNTFLSDTRQATGLSL